MMTKNEGFSRRRMIRTLGLGIGLTALPAYMKAEMLDVPLDALDPGEFIIPVSAREINEMEAFVQACIAANKEKQSTVSH